MARAALTSEEIEAFRERAVAAATHLFAEQGFEGASIRAVAAALGCSAMTPYRYFRNKEALFAAVRTAGFERFSDRQQAAATADDPRERLRALGAAYVQFAVDEPQAYRIMFHFHQGSTEPYPELEAAQRRAFSFLRDTAERGVVAGIWAGDPLTVAHLLWARVHGLVSLHLAGKLMMGRSLDQLMQMAIADGGAEPRP